MPSDIRISPAAQSPCLVKILNGKHHYNNNITFIVSKFAALRVSQTQPTLIKNHRGHRAHRVGYEPSRFVDEHEKVSVTDFFIPERQSNSSALSCLSSHIYYNIKAKKTGIPISPFTALIIAREMGLREVPDNFIDRFVGVFLFCQTEDRETKITRMWLFHKYYICLN